MDSTTSVGVTLSPTTMNRIKSAWRSFFSWMYASGRMRHNPALILQFKKAYSMPTAPITHHEIQHLLQTIRISPDPLARRDEALFATCAFTGKRRSEVLALKIKDFDPQGKMLLSRNAKSGNITLNSIPAVLVEILKNHIKDMYQIDNHHADHSLFSGRDRYCAISGRQALMRFQHWKKKAGLRENLTIHSFRAGYATILYETTGDLLLVSRMLGHKAIHNTQQYITLNAPAVRKALTKAFDSIKLN